jgi:hypothetical protein
VKQRQAERTLHVCLVESCLTDRIVADDSNSTGKHGNVDHLVLFRTNIAVHERVQRVEGRQSTSTRHMNDNRDESASDCAINTNSQHRHSRRQDERERAHEREQERTLWQLLVFYEQNVRRTRDTMLGQIPMGLLETIASGCLPIKCTSKATSRLNDVHFQSLIRFSITMTNKRRTSRTTTTTGFCTVILFICLISVGDEANEHNSNYLFSCICSL